MVCGWPFNIRDRVGNKTRVRAKGVYSKRMLIVGFGVRVMVRVMIRVKVRLGPRVNLGLESAVERGQGST